MRPKRMPLDLGFNVQHCPEVFVAGDEFERYGEQAECVPQLAPLSAQFWEGQGSLHLLSASDFFPIANALLPHPF